MAELFLTILEVVGVWFFMALALTGIWILSCILRRAQ